MTIRIDGSNTTANPGITGADADTGLQFGTNEVKIVTGGSDRVTVDSSGRVGVGTTSPTQLLEISGSVGNIQLASSGAEIIFTRSGPSAITASDASGSLLFQTGGTNERARIDSSGRLLVGTSTSFGGSYGEARIQVSGSLNGDPAEISLRRNYAGLSANGMGAVVIYSPEGRVAQIIGNTDGTQTSGTSSPGSLSFGTTPSGSTTPTERIRIRSDGYVNAGGFMGSGFHRFNGIDDVEGDPIFLVSGYQNSGGSNQDTAIFYGVSSSASPNGAGAAFKAWRHSSTNRSINAAGTINASGADYAEYMVKAGDFTIAKGSIAGVNTEGKLTNVFSDAISFVVKSTDPSYVGGDTWHLNVGEEPGGYNDDRTEEEIEAAKTVYKQQLEDARQKVDRIAFAGQVPVNVVGATPGQYIVPIVTEDGGITGIAKDEADLTLAEYMRAVGKVIAIEDDGRARIIVKVA